MIAASLGLSEAVFVEYCICLGNDYTGHFSRAEFDLSCFEDIFDLPEGINRGTQEKLLAIFQNQFKCELKSKNPNLQIAIEYSRSFYALQDMSPFEGIRAPENEELLGKEFIKLNSLQTTFTKNWICANEDLINLNKDPHVLSYAIKNPNITFDASSDPFDGNGPVTYENMLKVSYHLAVVAISMLDDVMNIDPENEALTGNPSDKSNENSDAEPAVKASKKLFGDFDDRHIFALQTMISFLSHRYGSKSPSAHVGMNCIASSGDNNDDPLHTWLDNIDPCQTRASVQWSDLLFATKYQHIVKFLNTRFHRQSGSMTEVDIDDINTKSSYSVSALVSQS
jgi:hypothetical protein